MADNHIASQADVASLRAHVDTKFEGLVSWIERVSKAVEHLADQRERIAVVETTAKSMSEHIANLWEQDSKKAEQITNLRTEMAKLVMRVSITVGIATSIALVVAQVFLKKFGLL